MQGKGISYRTCAVSLGKFYNQKIFFYVGTPQGCSFILLFSLLYLYNNNFSFMNKIFLFHLRSTASISIRQRLLTPFFYLLGASGALQSPIHLQSMQKCQKSMIGWDSNCGPPGRCESALSIRPLQPPFRTPRFDLAQKKY